MITWETSAKAFDDKYPKDMIPKTIQIAPIPPFEKIVRTSKGEPFEKFILLTHTIESIATLIENTIDVIPKAILCLDKPTFYSECWNFLEEHHPNETKKEDVYLLQNGISYKKGEEVTCYKYILSLWIPPNQRES